MLVMLSLAVGEFSTQAGPDTRLILKLNTVQE